VKGFSVRREVMLGLGLYALYLLVARLVLRRDGRARARRNADRIVALEQRLGLQVEPAVQRLLLRSPRLVHGLNVGYGLLNVTLTVGWLVLLFRRRDDGFHRFRSTCLLAHGAAQPVFLLLPTAPPRVLDGYVDTLSEVSGLDLEHAFLVRFYNPVAAMPSLHVAFAVITGAEIAERSGSLIVRSAARAYAPLVATVVAGTGNHYVLDAVAGAALGGVARWITRRADVSSA
jgi:PAP2 superfamily